MSGPEDLLKTLHKRKVGLETQGLKMKTLASLMKMKTLAQRWHCKSGAGVDLLNLERPTMSTSSQMIM